MSSQILARRKVLVALLSHPREMAGNSYDTHDCPSNVNLM